MIKPVENFIQHNFTTFFQMIPFNKMVKYSMKGCKEGMNGAFNLFSLQPPATGLKIKIFHRKYKIFV